ncbi:ATP-binding protein [Stenotrophomonas maltophilia]|uniref:ATP-binding protein n=1 Tax=Stenotrophomonas maltophilia TaxID=40324 RepID=UPI0019D461AA|nr:ATP-binding protein [Stenotrophomonas maltophilia]MBN7830659.1 ATP-binding protein [Stenotrophomonas maltophilia]MBN7834886.1 ATP-binding protein [Stenotrophomonas maltophilia]MBN7858786.1 ATP-binding protein [Stenotrophomonas maltophilia]MBN7918236.1 ATP-binding protein [Stenotrophomonas maltophilia]MBO2845360.1 ATP-binding protein [Stenotrophomonas maltophilia]
MDPRRNPYSPGAGTPPPELAGRDEVIEKADVALDRIKNGRAARSVILYGLRGVGKTVLLNKIKQDAEANGIKAVSIEAPENRSLPASLAPALRSMLLSLSTWENAKAKGKRAYTALGGFVGALKLKYNDIEMSVELPTESGLADSGDLEHDLMALMIAVGEAAMESGTAAVLFIDEIQHVSEGELGALIMALHAASQRQLPITLVGAGLPQLLGLMGDAKSYAERLFEFIPVDKLDGEGARQALQLPAGREGADFEDAALLEIVTQTAGYPYFLQEWGKHCWAIANVSPITEQDAKEATVRALAELDASFFRVRLDRLSNSEKKYMRAMAELGPGPHRSGDIANCMGRDVKSVAPTRSTLIKKGMVYAPSHGDTAFTVPLFDGYMKRVIPIFV